MLKCDFNKTALQRHTGKQRPRTLEHLEDLGPLGTQDTWEPRTFEDQGNLYLYHRTTSFERNTLQSKILIESNDKIIENKNYVINLLIH